MTRKQTPQPEPTLVLTNAVVNLPPLALDTKGAAAYLALEPATLEDWRMKQDQGPPFRRLGRRVVYMVADLEAWALAHPALGSTTQADAVKRKAS